MVLASADLLDRRVLLNLRLGKVLFPVFVEQGFCGIVLSLLLGTLRGFIVGRLAFAACQSRRIVILHGRIDGDQHATRLILRSGPGPAKLSRPHLPHLQPVSADRSTAIPLSSAVRSAPEYLSP